MMASALKEHLKQTAAPTVPLNGIPDPLNGLCRLRYVNCL
jgi:hypothetical protein